MHSNQHSSRHLLSRLLEYEVSLMQDSAFREFRGRVGIQSHSSKREVRPRSRKHLRSVSAPTLHMVLVCSRHVLASEKTRPWGSARRPYDLQGLPPSRRGQQVLWRLHEIFQRTSYAYCIPLPNCRPLNQIATIHRERGDGDWYIGPSALYTWYLIV